MDFQIGQEVKHQQFGAGVVIGLIDATHLKVKFEDDEFEKIVSPKFLMGYVAIGGSILAIHPNAISSAFLDYLFGVRDQVDIRIHYPKHAEPFVFELFSREGIDLPEDIRALASGKRGGKTVQRTLAGEIWFPTPENMNFVPQPNTSADGVTKISQLAVILSVLKAGFPLTKYATVA